MNTRDLVLISLLAALVAVLGLVPPIQLATGVPISAQTLGVMLAGSVLGARRAGIALLVFVLLVLAGLPLLAGGRGGLGVLPGPTGGFLLAWPLAAYAVGWLIERSWRRLGLLQAFIANVVGGIVLIYLVGVPWMAVVAELTPWQALIAAGAFIPGDLVKAGLAAFVAVSLKHSYPLVNVSATS